MNFCAQEINGQFVVIRVKKIKHHRTTRDKKGQKSKIIVVLCCPLLFLLFELFVQHDKVITA